MNKFETKTVTELEGLSPEDLQKYFEEKTAFEKEGTSLTALETKAKFNALESKLKTSEEANIEMKGQVKALASSVESLSKGKNVETKSAIQVVLESKDSEINALKSGNVPLKFELKQQTHSSIVNTSDFADMREGVIDQPKRSLTRIQDLFPKVKISKDVYKYTEQSAVVRDGRSVAYNTSFSPSNTSETLTVSSIEPKIVKALMDVSTDLIKDFPYMEGRSEKLVNESVAYKVEDSLINGSGLTVNVAGLTTYADEFDSTDAVNSGTPIEAVVDSIPDANMIDLILSMDMQISVHGEEFDYEANTTLMHRADWFKSGAMLKDSTGRYLDERIQRNGREVLIDGRLALVTSNNCPKGTLYVMDTTKGEIIDRDVLSVEIAYENGTKWEQEIATMKGYVRLNLLVANENKGAFQKCTDIPAAITAIGTVPTP